MFIVLLHQVFARGHLILLGKGGADADSDGKGSKNCANEHRLSLFAVQKTARQKTLAPWGYSFQRLKPAAGDPGAAARDHKIVIG